MEFARHLKNAVVALLFTVLVWGCRSETKQIESIDFTFKNSWVYGQIMDSKQYIAVDSLGAGNCTITQDSVFLAFPSEDINLSFYKHEVVDKEGGGLKFMLKDGLAGAELWMIQQTSQDFECELYVQDRMIRFYPTMKVVSTE